MVLIGIHMRGQQEASKMSQQEAYCFRCRIYDNRHLITQQKEVQIVYLLHYR